MDTIKLKSIKIKTLVKTLAILLFATANAILTAFRPVAMSSFNTGYSGSNAVDNNFDTYSHTQNTEIPWLNI